MNFYLSYSGVQFGAVTITAQAKGQAKAINDQLNSNVIKNVIASEKIQELPDANAAETISRLPGVSVQRTGGEGSKVVVRGLSPKYTSMMVEGVNMATSENDRSADISAISPYSLGGIELLKAITADKDANFVGGSINFILQEAKNNWHANIIMQAGYNGLKKSVNDYLFTGSISNRFFNQLFGVFAQINAENRNEAPMIRCYIQYSRIRW
ncbi:MAG: TonB-dependent receptor plug domain-containing protein [Saprospiraceae bacterium]|nr:TonB-dependent receptor plug domain-containing protein [Saprospiraceae bacterium]